MTSASTAVKRLNSESLQQKALTELKQDALELSLTKEDVKQFGNLSHKATWLAAINDAIGREFEAAPGDDSVQNQEAIANIETVHAKPANIAVTVIQSNSSGSWHKIKKTPITTTEDGVESDGELKSEPIPPINPTGDTGQLSGCLESLTPIRDQLLLKMMDKGLSLSDLEHLQNEPLDEDTATVFLTLLEESGRMLSEALAL